MPMCIRDSGTPDRLPVSPHEWTIQYGFRHDSAASRSGGVAGFRSIFVRGLPPIRLQKCSLESRQERQIPEPSQGVG